ncbi:sensor domain-containing diguanylate cyclase [Wenzhouxiangella sp. XN79A]|uniref:diguanylate cyclase domain-containing protein n=1 Tax=Wenzhouxiangella sp. XN79A TaxID=2724193 RepID=UPI00144AA878|nr:sensor domain-containing diguanylate cyclase [Wenzhouxiangella sp. XN79A]
MVLVGWLLLYLVGTLGSYAQHASLWFPPAALTLAALLVVGWRIAPMIALAIVLVTIWPVFGDPPSSSWIDSLVAGLVFSAAHLASYGLAAMALRQLARRAEHQLPLIVIDFVLVAVVGTLLASLLGPLALILSGLMDVGELAESWLAFWVGDLVAVIVLAPWLIEMLMRVTPRPGFRVRPVVAADPGWSGPFAVRLAANAVVISAAMLLAAGMGTVESAFAIFVLLLPQMWLTFSEPPTRTPIATAFNSAVVVGWLFVLDLEPFVFVYPFAVAIVATVAYFGVAIPLLARDNSRLRQSVMVDRLTGAGSREFLERQAALELRRIERSGAALSLLVIDLDRFKTINDERGHVSGDRVLAATSQAIRGVLRSGDVFARFGGDEFVALLPDTDPDIAGDVAERIRRVVREIDTDGHGPLTASIGLAESRTGDDFARLFERADRALYEAKRAGRDRLRIHTAE